MLPHPAVADPANVVQFFAPTKVRQVSFATNLRIQNSITVMVVVLEEVGRRHAALARCLTDIIQSHSGVKVFIEQEVPSLTRVVNGQTEHARMDHDGQVAWTTLMERDPHSKSHSVLADLAVTQCQLQSC